MPSGRSFSSPCSASCRSTTTIYTTLTVVNSRRELLVRLLQASGAASLLLAALYLAFPRLIIGQGVLASSVFVFVVAVVAWRLLFLQVGGARRLQEHVLIVGTGASARIVAREVLDQHDYAYNDRRVHRRRPGEFGAKHLESPGDRNDKRTSFGSCAITASTASSSAWRIDGAGCR